MKLSVAPVFPIWAIVMLVVAGIALRVAVVFAARRRGLRLSRAVWLRAGAAVLGMLCLGLAATRIGDESEVVNPPRLTSTAEESNINVFFVVDRSVNLSARDFDGTHSRLVGIVKDMTVVAGHYPEARFSVISYADTARVDWPLSPDVWSLMPFLVGIGPYGLDGADDKATRHVNVAAANDILKEQLGRAVTNYPGSANLVYVFGGSSDPGDWAFTIPEGQVSDGAVLGYGTTQGVDLSFSPGGGAPQVIHSALNEPALQTAAQSLHIDYVHREGGSPPSSALPTDVAQAAPVDPVTPKSPHPNRVEYYWLFSLLGALLVGVDLYDLAGSWQRSRRARTSA